MNVTAAITNVGMLLIHTSLWANPYPSAFSAIHAQRLFPQAQIGAKRFCAMRPKELYGATKSAMAVNPATRSMMNTARIPYLRIFFSGDQLKVFLCRFLQPLKL